MSVERDTTELPQNSEELSAVDSPIDPLQTREIENASDSDGSDTTTHEYSPYQSCDELEGKNPEADSEALPEGNESTKPSTSSEARSRGEISGDQGDEGDETKEEPVNYEASDAEYDGDVDDLAEITEIGDYEGEDYDEEVAEDDNASEDDVSEEQEEESDDGMDSDEEFVDLDEDEEIKFDENYHPTSIPAIITDSVYNSPIPSLGELQTTIREDEEFPFALLDDFQLDLESYMRANLHKQLALMDEISKLLTNSPADFEFDQLPDSADAEPPTEIIPIDFKPTAESRLRCSQKDQTKLYMVELWWVWVETLMPKISEDFLKKFKTILIDKCKPRYMSEYFVNEPKSGRKIRSPDPQPEVNDYDVRLYELQLIEDDELESDYEPDMNTPVYYKMPAAEHDDTGPEYPDIIVLDNTNESETQDTVDEIQGKRRKRSPIELQSSAKRRRTESGSKELESPKCQPPPLVLARRRSSQSIRSSASPPVLSPILRTPVKTTETPSKGSEIVLDPSKREPESSKKKKNRDRHKRRKPSKNLKFVDETDDEEMKKREEFCDSESVLSISDVEFDLSDDEVESFASDTSFLNLRIRLAELEEQAILAGDVECEEKNAIVMVDTVESQNVDPQPDVEVTVTANIGENCDFENFEQNFDEINQENNVKEIEEDSEPELYGSEGDFKETEKSTDYDEDENEINAQLEFNGVILKGEDLAPLVAANIISIESESEVIDWTEGDRIFPTNTVNELDKKFEESQMDPVSRELLKAQRELAVALFQFRQKSKLMYDFLSEELERQELVNELEKAEEKLYDNLEGSSEKVNNEELLEAFKVLTNYYNENGLQLDSLEEDSPDLVALRNLDISERSF